jgi:hypothetical protein
MMGCIKLDPACQRGTVLYNALKRHNPMNERSQHPDTFHATDTHDRLYELFAVIFFILVLGVVAMYELQ